MSADIQWPEKKRELHNHHFDSTMWNGFEFRDDDIVIATYAKSGTTWMQQIVSQLIFNGKEGLNLPELSPWLDLRFPEKQIKHELLNTQQHRRFIKTHLPVDALVFSPRAKYIYVARDGRDVLWSFYNHHIKASEQWYAAINDTPGRVGPPIEPPPDSITKYYHDWLDRDGYPFWPMWENVQSWWDIRHLPNVYLVHFVKLKGDMAGEIRKIARFLDFDMDELNWDDIVVHCSFEYMKAHADQCIPGELFEGGSKSFINKGVNGRWQEVLTPEDIKKYETIAAEKLTPDCAHWLATGET